MGVLHDLGQAGSNIMTGITNSSKMATAGRDKGNVGSKLGTMAGELGGGVQSAVNDLGTMGQNAVGKVVNGAKKELVGGGDIMKDNRQLEQQKAITQGQANKTMSSDLGKANGGFLQGIHAGYDATDNADTSAMKSNPVGTVGKMVGNDIGLVPGIGTGAKVAGMGAGALAEGLGDADLSQAKQAGTQAIQGADNTVNNAKETIKNDTQGAQDYAQTAKNDAQSMYNDVTTTQQPANSYTGTSPVAGLESSSDISKKLGE